MSFLSRLFGSSDDSANKSVVDTVSGSANLNEKLFHDSHSNMNKAFLTKDEQGGELKSNMVLSEKDLLLPKPGTEVLHKSVLSEIEIGKFPDDIKYKAFDGNSVYGPNHGLAKIEYPEDIMGKTTFAPTHGLGHGAENRKFGEGAHPVSEVSYLNEAQISHLKMGNVEDLYKKASV